MNVEFGFQAAFALLHFQQFHKRAVAIFFRQNRLHHNLLHQFLVIGFNGIQAVNLVAAVFMGCRIAQDKQRSKGLQRGKAVFPFPYFAARPQSQSGAFGGLIQWAHRRFR